jgi:hypothetical protein
MQLFLSHWKTTANGVLFFLISTLSFVQTFLGVSDVTQPGASVSFHSIHAATWVVTAVNLALGLCRVWIGLLQQDAGSQLAYVPGKSEPEVVDSHENPNNPRAVPVVTK